MVFIEGASTRRRLRAAAVIDEAQRCERQAVPNMAGDQRIGSFEIASPRTFAECRCGQRLKPARAFIGIALANLQLASNRAQYPEQKFVMRSEQGLQLLADLPRHRRAGATGRNRNLKIAAAYERRDD